MPTFLIKHVYKQSPQLRNRPAHVFPSFSVRPPSQDDFSLQFALYFAIAILRRTSRCANVRSLTANTPTLSRTLSRTLSLSSRTNAALVMQFLLINALDCLAILLFLYLLDHLRDRRRRGGLPYPPGPSTRPVIGNLLDIPKDLSWRMYADMSNKYGRRDCDCLRETDSPQLKPAFQGDVIGLHIFSGVIIVLCSSSAIKDLIENRGRIYSERPSLPLVEMYVLWHDPLISQSPLC